MMNLNMINKLIKKTRRWHKKTGFSLFQRAAGYFEQKKKETIFSVINALGVRPGVANDAASEPSRIIWICWFQGLESAPALVKRCVESIQNNAGDSSIIIITEDNYDDYVLLPDSILLKYKSGLIGKAHFSDILRCCLLYQYGGVWLDSTIFLSKKLPDAIFQTPFCSLRFDYVGNFESISKGVWTTYFLASEKNGYLIGRVKEALVSYWEKHSDVIDYFLMDYIFLYYFESDPSAKKMILTQPVLGNKRFLLKEIMNEQLSPELKEALARDKAGIYKLSYKTHFRTEAHGQPTVYSKILDGTFRLE